MSDFLQEFEAGINRVNGIAKGAQRGIQNDLEERLAKRARLEGNLVASWNAFVENAGGIQPALEVLAEATQSKGDVDGAAIIYGAAAMLARY